MQGELFTLGCYREADSFGLNPVDRDPLFGPTEIRCLAY